MNALVSPSPPPVQPGTATASPLEASSASAIPEVAVQRIIKVRRDYNSWVASETMEDYALRFTPQRFRKWSEFRVANTAFGAASFLILEAVGATLLVKYGFTNAFWAIVATGLITQMGEQADYLRFMPVQTQANRWRWWAGCLSAGRAGCCWAWPRCWAARCWPTWRFPIWVPPDRAVDPNQMYLAAYEYVFADYGWAVGATALFVVVSQLKINVTNAYAGSWPGRTFSRA
jgi:hypothetical protein